MPIRHMLGSFVDGARILNGTVQAAALAAAAYASATDMENQATASDTSKLVSPAMFRHHPGFPKAWAKFTPTGGVVAAYNVSTATGITVNGTGDFNVTFITHFSATGNYAGFVSVDASDNDYTGFIESYASNGLQVQTFDSGGGTLADAALLHVNVVCFGDQ